jgi:hypothetical protein
MSLAVEDPPTRLPDAGVVRDARARRRRRRRRTLAAALLGIATSGALVAGFAGNSRSGSPARGAHGRPVGFATPGESPEQRCRSQLPAATDLVPGAGRCAPRPRPPALSVGFWHTVLADTRGPITIIVFEAATGRANEVCFVGRTPKSGVLAGGYGTRPPAPVAAEAVSIVGSGGYKTPPAEGSHRFSWIVGRAGTAVGAVTVRFADGGHVVARRAGGWFLAWWRGRRPLALTHAINAVVTGRTSQRAA